MYEHDTFETTFTGGVRVATADFNADGFPDVACAAGTGGGPRVSVLDGKSGSPLNGIMSSFFAFEPHFSGGVTIAAGDVNGDGMPDLILGAGSGGGPRVEVFSGRDGSVLASFYAYDPKFTGGVTVAAADLNRDGKADVIVGEGPGGDARVRVFDLSSGTPDPLNSPLGDFQPFGDGFRGGVNVGADGTAGDVDGDGTPDLLVGSGMGSSPRVVVYSGKTGTLLTSITPFQSGMTGGVHVSAAYIDDDARADIVVGSGAGHPASIEVYSGATGALLGEPVGTYTPFSNGELGGVNVAASNDPPPNPPPPPNFPLPLPAGAVVTPSIPNTAPRFRNPALQLTVNEDDAVNQPNDVVDDEDSDFFYTASNLPPGLEIDGRSGIISGWIDPRAANGGQQTYTANITVQDVKGAQSTTTDTFVVNHVNHAPRLYDMYPSIYPRNVPLNITIGNYFCKSVDIDTNDTLTYSFTNLPPGLQSSNKSITGMPTTAGTWTVTATVSDGHGGTDSRPFTFIIAAPASGTPAPPTVQMSPDSAFSPYPSLIPKAILVGQPEQIYVRLGQPDATNPTAPVPVVLNAPAGVTVSPSSFSITSTQVQSVTVTASAASAKLADITVTATVPKWFSYGMLELTGVTYTAPSTIRGKDTPSGSGPGTSLYMPDRISVGTQNWGSFTGSLQITPALMGVNALGVDVASAGGNQYGVASVDSNDVARANLVGRSILHVVGASFTQPDTSSGLPVNANQLRLRTTLGSATLLSDGFSVANIPVATIARTIAVYNADYAQLNGGFWTTSALFQMICVQDGNSSDSNLMYTEDLRFVSGKDIGISTSNASFDTSFIDINGHSTTRQYPDRYSYIQDLISYAVSGHQNHDQPGIYQQVVRYYNRSIQAPPASPVNLDAVNAIELSGYYLSYGPFDTQIVNLSPQQTKYYYQFTRIAYQWGAVKKGAITDLSNQPYEQIKYEMDFAYSTP